MRTLTRWGVALVALLGMVLLTVREAAAEVVHRTEVVVLGTVRTAAALPGALRDAIDRLLLMTMSPLFLRTGAVGDLITQKRADLQKLITELSAGQEEMKKGPLSQARGEELEKKAQEAEALQAEIDQYDRRERIIGKGRQVPDPTLPETPEERKQERAAGYLTLGDYVLMSPAFQQLKRAGFPTGSHATIQIAAALDGKNAILGPHGEPLVAIDAEQRKAIEELISTKAVPTLGTGVIPEERLARFAQVTADDRLNLRDVLSVGQTSAGSVTYLREESHTQAAAETAHGSAKPEEALEYTEQTAAVKTIAGWMPVHNQQLEDLPQLRGLIDGRLRYSVRRREAHQLLWGNGSGANIEGIFDVSGTQDIEANGRYDSGDHTLIDVVRMGITDVRVAGYEPNFVGTHPYDWEAIVLEKGTDNRYVWAVVTDREGTRIWGLRAVEDVAFQQRAGNPTEARRLLVGDGQMGAQILDRMALSVVVGLVNDQLIKNMRTILAEERLAFPIYAPAAFAWFETQASAT